VCQPLLFMLCKTEHPNPLFFFGSDLIRYRCTCIMPANFDLFQRLSCVHVHTHVLYWICPCRNVCFALNVPSPSALHPPHLGGYLSFNISFMCTLLQVKQTTATVGASVTISQVGSRPPSTTTPDTVFHQHQECRKGDGKQDLRPLRYVNIGIIWL